MGIVNNALSGASGQSSGYNLTNSLRFRRSATAYLNRTPGVAGNRRTYTWSGWLKLGTLGVAQEIFGAGSGANQDLFNFNADYQFVVFSANASQTLLRTAQLFRDPSAWYHIVVAVDTTQATASNRTKIYVNGVQVTAFEYTQYPSPNYQGSISDTGIHYISTYDGSNWAFDGYMAEVNFIDGQQLTSSSFGQTSASTGVWIPKKYTGTYGTNGFYLPFTNTASTSTLGNDFSGNGNNWTTNNISLTAGSTYDSMTDVPTLTSATAANYCVLNPLNKIYSTFTLSNGNLNWTSDTVNMGGFGTIQLPTSGKYYWEIVMTVSAGGSPQIGVGGGTASLGDLGAYYRTNGNKEQYGGVSGNGSSAYGATWTTNDVIGIAYDADTSSGQITFYKNNSSQGVAFSSLKTNFPNGLFPVFQNNASGTTTFQANFGQRPFTYTPPSGFVRLNTFNLTTPTIGATAATQANDYFNVVTWTGNGTSSGRSITGVGFQPDFVWGKARSVAYGHGLYDAVRGSGKLLVSNNTNSEATNFLYGYLSSFDSDGFTTTAGSSSNENWNQTNDTYVAWNWKANGAGVTNTAGSITSTVSANTTAGFSIVTWTGNGVTAATVGHGLGVVPAMIICKERSVGGEYWHVKHQSTASNTNLFLNVTNASTSAASVGDGILADLSSSTTFGFATAGSPGNVVAVNENGVTNVAYCFAQVAGYSAFGSYTGNGSTDGPFVFIGFRPRYVLIKRTDSAEDWIVMDSARNTYNVANSSLFPNGSFSETTDSNRQEDFLSNGFKIRSSGVWLNASGGTFIYMAFAESPFKYANAR